MSKLHKLFNDAELKRISDGTHTMEVLFRSLTNKQDAIIKQLATDEREAARSALDTTQHRADFRLQRRSLGKEHLVSHIIGTERPVVDEFLDLAPNFSGEEETDSQRMAKSQEALTRWHTHRRTNLMETEVDVLVELAVDRDIEQTISNRVSEFVLGHRIAMTVTDPETQAPLVSMDPESEDAWGDLNTSTKMLLMQFMADMQKNQMQTAIRTAAGNRPSSSPGVSPKRADDSRGGMAATSLTFPTPLSTSTTSASGATALKKPSRRTRRLDARAASSGG